MTYKELFWTETYAGYNPVDEHLVAVPEGLVGDSVQDAVDGAGGVGKQDGVGIGLLDQPVMLVHQTQYGIRAPANTKHYENYEQGLCQADLVLRVALLCLSLTLGDLATAQGSWNCQKVLLWDFVVRQYLITRGCTWGISECCPCFSLIDRYVFFIQDTVDDRDAATFWLLLDSVRSNADLAPDNHPIDAEVTIENSEQRYSDKHSDEEDSVAIAGQAVIGTSHGLHVIHMVTPV